MNDEEILILRLIERSRTPDQATDMPFGFFKFYPPVSSDELEYAEQRLGFHLPHLLRKMYLQVGNGGFGPGYGFLALNKNGSPNYHMNLVDWYLECTNPSHESFWPRDYIVVIDWGDGITSAVKWTDPDSPVYRCNGDQYEEGSFEQVMKLESPSLKTWLQDWLNGLPLFYLGR